MALSSTIKACLAGKTVRAAHLVEFCFKTQARRVWNGNYKLHAGGHDWFGLRKLGTIEGFEQGNDLSAEQMRFTVSGVDARFLNIIKTAIGEDKDEYVGRLAEVFLCFFDENWQVLDSPVALAAGIMESLEVTRVPMEGGGTRRIITLTATNIFYGRGVPPASYFSNRDQQLRHPGDRGLEHMAELQEIVIQIPW